MTAASGRTVHAYDLGPGEVRQLDELTRRVAARRPGSFLPEARRIAAAGLPTGVYEILERLRASEFAPVVAIRGLPVDDVAIGPTPDHWRGPADPAATLREDAYLLLVASVLGDVFGWESLQEGRLVQNVLPIRTQENEQS